MQGRSPVLLLNGHVPEWPQDFFYGHDFRPSWLRTNKDNIPSSEGLRPERWKYVHYFDEKPPHEQLFDLKATRTRSITWRVNRLMPRPWKSSGDAWGCFGPKPGHHRIPPARAYGLPCGKK